MVEQEERFRIDKATEEEAQRSRFCSNNIYDIFNSIPNSIPNSGFCNMCASDKFFDTCFECLSYDKNLGPCDQPPNFDHGGVGDTLSLESSLVESVPALSL
jgi:hypothetical protein